MKKTLIRKQLALLIAIIMLLTALPLEILSIFAVEEMEMTAIEEDVHEVCEITEKRGEFEKHFKMSDGTVKVVLYAEPVHYIDADNKWQEIDNTLTLNPSGTRYVAVAGDFSAELGSSAKMINGDSAIEWSVKTITEDGKNEIGSITAPVSGNISSAGVLSADSNLSSINTGVITSTDAIGSAKPLGRLTVSHPEKSVIMSSSVVKDKITQNVTILKSGDFTGYEVSYKLNGLTPELTENNMVTLNNAEGNHEYTTSPLLIIDSNGRISEDYTVSISTVNDIATVTYNVADESLTAPITIITETVSSSYTSGIIDTTKISGELSDSNTLPWLYVGYENYNYSTHPGSTVKARYTIYIKFSHVPDYNLEKSLGLIKSAKLCFKPSEEGLTDDELKSCSPAVFSANPFRTSSESSSQCSYTSLGSSSYVTHNIESDVHYDMEFDSERYMCSFDVTNMITDYNAESMFYAIDYTDVVDNGDINDTSNTNRKTSFFSSECGNYANLGTTIEDMPRFEMTYYDISEYNYMVLNTRSNGKYLDMSAEGLPTVTAVDEYKRENLWSFERVPGVENSDENTYYIRTSESVYINKVYDDIIPEPESDDEEKLLDTDVKYLGLNDENTGIITTSSTTGRDEWTIDITSDGRVMIYTSKTTGSTTQRYYLYQGGQGTLVPSVTTTNAYWSLTRCDVISGKVYTIKSVGMTSSNDEAMYMSVEGGYDHNNTDIIVQTDANRSEYKHQSFRVEYLPSKGAYKIRSMVCMNGWYRPIDIIRSSGNIIEGCKTQIYDDSDGTTLTTDDCQLLDILPSDIQLGVNTIAVYATKSDISSDYTMCLAATEVSGTDMVTVNEIDGESCEKWVFEEYTTTYEEYYKSLGILFPVVYDAPYEVLSSWARRNPDVVGTYASREHAGVDFVFRDDNDEAVGATIIAPFDAEVVDVGYNSTLGNFVVLESLKYEVCGSSQKIIVILQHMETTAYVLKDDIILAGTEIGFVGNTGASGGIHLHYSVITNGAYRTNKYVNTIDPLVFYNRNLFYYEKDIRYVDNNN